MPHITQPSDGTSREASTSITQHIIRKKSNAFIALSNITRAHHDEIMSARQYHYYAASAHDAVASGEEVSGELR